MMTVNERRALCLVALYLASCLGQRREVKPEVERLWRQHEKVLIDAASKKIYREDELIASVLFFEKATGIRSRRGLEEAGDVAVPTDELRGELDAWRSWYEAHKERLYIDSVTGALREH